MASRPFGEGLGRWGIDSVNGNKMDFINIGRHFRRTTPGKSTVNFEPSVAREIKLLEYINDAAIQ